MQILKPWFKFKYSTLKMCSSSLNNSLNWKGHSTDFTHGVQFGQCFLKVPMCWGPEGVEFKRSGNFEGKGGQMKVGGVGSGVFGTCTIQGNKVRISWTLLFKFKTTLLLFLTCLLWALHLNGRANCAPLHSSKYKANTCHSESMKNTLKGLNLIFFFHIL